MFLFQMKCFYNNNVGKQYHAICDLFCSGGVGDILIELLYIFGKIINY